MTESKGSSFGAAIAGGVVGSVLTAAVLLFAAPQYLSGRIVRQGMLNDPHILVEASDALRDAQYKPTLDASRGLIETPFASSWKGSSKPKVTLVEFYDYACPYCKASNPHVDQLVRENPDLRVVYRELPILGDNSVAAARLSLAASKAGRFQQFHDALYAAGRPAPETNTAAARTAQVDPKSLDDPAIEAELRKNFSLASQLGATGTPLFIVGDRVLSGAVGYDALKKAVEDARKSS
ncbi:DsbA family protein [Sphingomonas daechungensis]|uniref:DsbA family protein n=1 Tax=Sphingomonas daechungensis TaxID=1176646 RepID=UPI0031E55AFF